MQSVTANGQPLSFIQEDKNEDGDYFVILPKALTAGEKLSVTTTYAGKDAVVNTGGGNYYPVARENWYPSDPGSGLGEYALYDMTLRIPKGMKMAATGVLLGNHRRRQEHNRVEERGSANRGRLQLWPVQGRRGQAHEAGIFHSVLCQRRISGLGAGPAA